MQPLKHLACLLLTFCATCPLPAQPQPNRDFYGRIIDRQELCQNGSSFMSEQDVDRLIAEILAMQGLNNRFITVGCPSVSNCVATLDRDRRPVILFNPSFLQRVQKLQFREVDLPTVGEKDWPTLTILAHEIGHHLNNHLTNPLPGATAPQMELEADRTAGFLVYLMGGELEQARKAFQDVSETGTYTHPPRNLRLEALGKGFADAAGRFVRSNRGKPNPAPAPTPARDPAVSYSSVKIGTQVWMSANLNVTRFRNGDPIPEVQDEEAFRQAGLRQQPAWCHYEGKAENGRIYGKLYNWYAVNDPRGLAPEGWHIPSQPEVDRLVKHLGGPAIAGKKMKTNVGWSSNDPKFPAKPGTNESGFSALPGGNHNSYGFIGNLGGSAFWWTSTTDPAYPNQAWFWSLYVEGNGLNANTTSKIGGKSVRCIRDTP